MKAEQIALLQGLAEKLKLELDDVEKEECIFIVANLKLGDDKSQTVGIVAGNTVDLTATLCQAMNHNEAIERAVIKATRAFEDPVGRMLLRLMEQSKNLKSKITKHESDSETSSKVSA